MKRPYDRFSLRTVEDAGPYKADEQCSPYNKFKYHMEVISNGL